ncbi:MAG: hypothetical protein V4616_02300 [Bacteroidota bacterium]
MTKTLIPAIAIAFLTLFSVSCKKEKAEETPTPVVKAPNPATKSMLNAIELSEPHDGALYSYILMTENPSDGSWTKSELKSGHAWFGNDQNTEDVGELSINGNPLVNEHDPSQLDWYFGTSNDSANVDQWTATGERKYPAFSVTDSTPYPEVTNLVITPAVLTSTSDITVTYSANDATAVVIIAYTASGKSVSTVEMDSGTKTVTFSAKQLKELLDDSPGVFVQLLPVKLTLRPVGAKNYYFVKELVYLRQIPIN